MHSTAPNPLLELRKLGESVWLDDISRGMLEDGSLARLIHDDGDRGPHLQSVDLRQLDHARPAVRAADRAAPADGELGHGALRGARPA